MYEIPAKLRAIQTQGGWDDKTLLHWVYRYIEEQQCVIGLPAFLRGVVDQQIQATRRLNGYIHMAERRGWSCKDVIRILGMTATGFVHTLTLPDLIKFVYDYRGHAYVACKFKAAIDAGAFVQETEETPEEPSDVNADYTRKLDGLVAIADFIGVSACELICEFDLNISYPHQWTVRDVLDFVLKRCPKAQPYLAFRALQNKRGSQCNH